MNYQFGVGSAGGPEPWSRARELRARQSEQTGGRRYAGLALTFFLVALTAEVGLRAATGSYEIGTWRGFRPAAISYTFDDGCSNQFSVAIPMFNEKGFKLTLFTAISTLFPGWPKLQSAALQGHEIGSHTMTHVNLSSLSDAQQTTELKDSREAIDANIPGQTCITLAYPFCVEGKEGLTSQQYVAARTCSGQLVPSSPANLMNISSFVCGPQGSVQTTPDFNSRANGAAAARAWCVYLIHGIDNDGGYSPLSTATLQGSLNYLSANPEKFWVETFGNVIRYILERNAASVSETSNQDDEIRLQVSDNLDDKIFNYPITLRRLLPTNWPGAAVSQNQQRREARVVEVNSTRYIMFDVVPDGGEVVLVKEVRPIILSHPTAATSGDFDFRLEGQTGARYVVFSSSDLVNWTPARTNTLVSSYTNFTFPLAATPRFYRAQWAP